jgi:DNA polymerase I-like protein with 3'-5' exonuclease and polymerase domains
MWGNQSGDKAVAESFLVGYRLRQEFIKNPTDELRKELKTKGDFHIQTVYHMFKVWIEKSDPKRDAQKQITFGVIYGKSARTLGRDLQNSKIKDLKAKIRKVKAEIKALA